MEDKLKKEINRNLEIFFARKVKEMSAVSGLAVGMAKNIRDFTMAGGKRLRPSLVYYGYLAAAGRNKNEILKVSIFIELLHSFLLIHDDIVDRDELRRGEPTMHRLYAENYITPSQPPPSKGGGVGEGFSKGRAEHFGLSCAIMAGDLAASFAYEILAESKFPENLKTKAIQRLNKILSDVIAGETIDIFSGAGKRLNAKDVLKIYEYKTARYTIEGPLQIGAMLADANKRVLKILSDYAVPLGIAFQIEDDILGVFGDEKVTGKSVESDIKEGKQTLLILKTLELADEKQKKLIKSVLGNQKLAPAQLSQVRKIIKESGAYDYVLKEAGRLVEQSKAVIGKSALPREVKEFLSGLADYVLSRGQ